MNRLQGKTILITAAGQGIGRAIAERIVEEGGTLIATDVRQGALAGLNGRLEQLDVTDAGAIQTLFGSLGSLHGLVNCAGVVHHGDILACDEEAWRFSFELNVHAAYHTMRSAVPLLLAGGGGSIVNISSVVSSVKAAPNRFAYGATKAALIGMTKGVAADYVTSGIRANAICPGTVDSPSWRGRVDEQSAARGVDRSVVEAEFVARQPMGRVGTPQEIAALAAYLLSDESAFTTGQALVIDGGWSN